MLPCALVKYLVNRMAYNESTAWFRVQHCLKPLTPICRFGVVLPDLFFLDIVWLFFQEMSVVYVYGYGNFAILVQPETFS